MLSASWSAACFHFSQYQSPDIELHVSLQGAVITIIAQQRLARTLQKVQSGQAHQGELRGTQSQIQRMTEAANRLELNKDPVAGMPSYSKV